MPARFKAEGWAALCAGSFAFVWFYGRLSPSVAFGPWLGPFLADSPVPDLPLLSYWLARAVVAACDGEPMKAALALNMLSAGWGALCCAMLALMAAGICRGLTSRFEAFLCGVAAGLAFALTPSFSYAATAAGPTTLSVFLALASLAGLCLRAGTERGLGLLFLSALCAGLATANHPSFAFLLMLVLLASTSAPSLRHVFMSTGLVVLPGFLLGALVPVVTSIAAGESPREFLAHALQTPYPAIGEGAPHLGFGGELLQELPWTALVLALLAFALSLRTRGRLSALAWAVVFLAMGPFLPSVTNQFGHDVGLKDPVAPFCVVIGLVCAFVACGGAFTAALVFRKRAVPRFLLTVALPVVAYAICLWPAAFVTLPQMPNRNHTRAMELGKRILADCPLNALLVSGNAELTSLVCATQFAAQYRDDVTVIASEWLVVPRFRQRLGISLGDSTHMPQDFPSPETWGRWQKEQPLLLKQTTEHSAAPDVGGYIDLAIWDLVRDNSRRRSVCFIGLDSQWLMARATPAGTTAMYPESDVVPSSVPPAFIVDAQLLENRGGDTGFSKAVARLLLPLSENARLQDNPAESLRLAHAAAELTPDDPAPWLAVARAAARNGQKDIALDAASTCIQLSSNQEAPFPVSVKELLAADFERRETAAQFSRLVDEPQGGGQKREELASRLWQADELVVLERGYAAMSAMDPNDVDALYQRAAALTQLGRLSIAREALTRALEAAPAETTARVMNDGRFALLYQFDDEGDPGADQDAAPGASQSSSGFADA